MAISQKANNDETLRRIILEDLRGIIDAVAEKLYQKLIGNDGFIEEIVYSKFTPKEYLRRKMNGGLQGEWKKTDAKKRLNTVTAKITEDPNSMENTPEEFIHGSEFWAKTGITDIRDLLADFIINGKSGPLFGEGPWQDKRDFWTPFIELLTDGTADRFLEEEFRNRGIEFRKL